MKHRSCKQGAKPHHVAIWRASQKRKRPVSSHQARYEVLVEKYDTPATIYATPNSRRMIGSAVIDALLLDGKILAPEDIAITISWHGEAARFDGETGRGRAGR
jgi:hypothetical protein